MNKEKKTLIALLVAGTAGLLVVASLSAQTVPTVDGVVEANEYQFEQVDGPIHLYASFTDNRIYLAAVVKSRGWVAVGVGSDRMDRAKIFMGSVSDGQESFTVQAGRFHRHSETNEFGAVAHKLTENADSTSMELALDRGSFTEPGQTTLEVIYATASSDDVGRYHSFRGATSLKIE